jgi:hypothetical protein
VCLCGWREHGSAWLTVLRVTLGSGQQVQRSSPCAPSGDAAISHRQAEGKPHLGQVTRTVARAAVEGTLTPAGSS